MSYEASRSFRSAGPTHMQRQGDRELPALQATGIYSNQPVPMDPEYSGLFPQYPNQNVGPQASAQYGILPHQARHTHTCSADSPYAHPDEDWRNEPDLGRRRRVQNRVAQRKYRACKKEKERIGKTEKSSSHGSNNIPVLDGAQNNISKPSKFYNRSTPTTAAAKPRFRDVVPTIEQPTPSLSPRAPNATGPDFPRAIGQSPATNYQVHYTTAPYQVSNPITASSTWQMGFSQPDLSAPMLSGPQLGNNSSAMNYMKHHHATEDDLSVYNRGNGQPPNYSDQNAHELGLDQLPAFTTSPSLSANDVGPDTPQQIGPLAPFSSIYAQDKRPYIDNYLGMHRA